MGVLDVRAKLTAAKVASGKSYIAQVKEILALRRSRGCIGLSEYFEYQLFDDSRFTMREKREFTGWRTKYPLREALDLHAWKAFTIDKVSYQCAAHGFGLPVPELFGIYSQRRRIGPKGVPCFATVAELEDFLRCTLTYPAFAKPIVGKWGEGAMLLDGLHDKDAVVVRSRGPRSIADVARQLSSKNGGYVFQEVLKSDAALGVVTGDRLASARVVMLNGGDAGPILHRAVLKVPTGNNIQDNFMHGQNGNMLAGLDRETGRVSSMVGGGAFWPTSHDTHPDTDASMIDFEVPQWPAIRCLLHGAATAFPGARLQGWDVALTDRGPVLLEMNIPMDSDLVQLATERGLWDEQFDRFHKEITSRAGPWFENI